MSTQHCLICMIVLMSLLPLYHKSQRISNNYINQCDIKISQCLRGVPNERNWKVRQLLSTEQMATLQFLCFLSQSAASLNQNSDLNAAEVNGEVDIDFSELQLSSELLQEAAFQPRLSHGSPRQLIAMAESSSHINFVMVTSTLQEQNWNALLCCS